MGAEQMGSGFIRFVHCLVLKKQTAQFLAGLSGRLICGWFMRPAWW
jgi:hypothetical protein